MNFSKRFAIFLLVVDGIIAFAAYLMDDQGLAKWVSPLKNTVTGFMKFFTVGDVEAKRELGTALLSLSGEALIAVFLASAVKF